MNTSKRVARAIAKSHAAEDVDVLLQTRVRASVASRIRQFAEEEEITVAAYLRRLLNQHVDSQE